MFEQAFKNIDDVLRKEAGCTTELDYTEQTSWLLFLKYLDALEQDKAVEAVWSRKRRTLYDAQNEIDRKKETLIANVEARLEQRVEAEPLFTIQWKVA